MSISIRWRLAAGIVLAFIVTLAVIFVTVQLSLERLLTNDLDNALSGDASYVLAEINLVGLDNQAELQRRVQGNANSAEGRTPFITVIRNASGKALVSTNGVQQENLALTADELDQVATGKTLERSLELPGQQEYRIRTQRISVAGQSVGVVQVGRVTAGVVAPVNTLIEILIAEGIAATLLTVGVAVWLSRGAVKPLQRVIDVAAEIQASDLRRRIHATRQPAEVQKLADTFDAMLQRLETAFQEQQNFVMDVSHELRTPLTAVKGSIDVMLMERDLDTQTRDIYERMSAEVARLIRLTTNLLYMASADAGREPERRPIDLDVLCLEVLRQSRDLRQDVKLGLGHEDQVTVVGDRDQIKQMVFNLIENAVKYSPSDGQVTLSLHKDDTEAQIRVVDTGAGIPPEILPHIFQRFYRGNHRSLMGGTGLGLAIADRIARAHGGSIAAESAVGRGSTFTVSLPLGVGGGDQSPTLSAGPPDPIHLP